MDDLAIKIETILMTNKTKLVSQQYESNISPNPEIFMKDLITFFPKLVALMDNLTDQIKNVVGKSKEKNADITECLYSDSTILLKKSLNLLLRVFYAVFSWPKFQLERNREFLVFALQQLLPDTTFNDIPFEDLCEEGFQKFLSLENEVLLIKSATCLYQILQAIAQFKHSELREDKSLGEYYFATY